LQVEAEAVCNRLVVAVLEVLYILLDKHLLLEHHTLQ